ncbi:MAG: Ig domain-containing protein, partial [Candidatus Korobacteraceae bacterium]
MRLFRILALSGLAFLLCMFLAACGGGSTPPPAPGQLGITSRSFPNGAVNTPYQTFLTANGGTPPYTWSIASGSLPPGLTISNTSEISGTPTTFGKSSFTAKVTDTSGATDTAPVSITIEGLVLINCAPPNCGSGTMTLQSGNPGTPYSAMLTASGGKAPYTWSLASGSSLPAGLMISTDSNGNGIISGTPTTPGPPMTFTVQATDSESTPSTGTAILSLTIIQISTTSLPNATINSPYNASLTAVGGQSNYTWTVVGGSLPTGLSISNSSCLNSKNPTCSITGTPTGMLGIYPVTFQVSDGGNPPAKATSVNLSIDLQGPKLIITTSSEPQGTVGQPYTGQLQATGGIPPLSWCIIERNGNCDDGSGGSLPPGLSLDPTTCQSSQVACQIVGTPTTAGLYPFIPRVQDSENPPQIVAGAFPLTIQINPAMSVASLTGNYAFSFNGYQNGNPVLMAGAFLADGGGNLRTGKLDVNDGSGEPIDNHGFVIPQTIGVGSVY